MSSDSFYKLWLIKNIKLVSIIPKDIAVIITSYLFYDKDVAKHRKLLRNVTDTITNPDIFVKRRCYNSWHYDEQLEIFTNASNTWIIYVKTKDVTKLCETDMCATMCDDCSEYIESETVPKEEIPLRILCKC